MFVYTHEQVLWGQPQALRDRLNETLLTPKLMSTAS